MKNRIVIVGSSNTDMVVRVDHFPLPGETLMGNNFLTAQGGKGANQAVAVARLGGVKPSSCAVWAMMRSGIRQSASFNKKGWIRLM